MSADVKIQSSLPKVKAGDDLAFIEKLHGLHNELTRAYEFEKRRSELN